MVTILKTDNLQLLFLYISDFSSLVGNPDNGNYLE